MESLVIHLSIKYMRLPTMNQEFCQISFEFTACYKISFSMQNSEFCKKKNHLFTLQIFYLVGCKSSIETHQIMCKDPPGRNIPCNISDQ